MADLENYDAETKAKIEAGRRVDVGDTVLYNAADGRGLVEATVTRVRPLDDPDAAPEIDITYPHPREDANALATAERCKHGGGGYQWIYVDEYEPPAPPSKIPRLASMEPSADAGRIAELETKLAESDLNLAGLEMTLRSVLGVSPDATGEEVKAAIEAMPSSVEQSREAWEKLKAENTTLHEENERLGLEVAAAKSASTELDAEFLCIVADCDRAKAGEGYSRIGDLRRHAGDKHNASVNVAEDGVITYGELVSPSNG